VHNVKQTRDSARCGLKLNCSAVATLSYLTYFILYSFGRIKFKFEKMRARWFTGVR